MNVTQLDADLKAKRTEIEALLTDQMQKAETEQRERTAEEIATVQAKLDEGKAIKARLDKAQGTENQRAAIEGLTAGFSAQPTPTALAVQRPQLKSMGQQLIENPDWQAFVKSGAFRSSSAWSSPSIELFATTLDTTSGSGGQLVITDFQPGILPLLFKRLMVADLLASGTTSSNSITYFKETAFTNNTTAVAEGATKPESALTFALQSDLVRKIAHWLPVSEEMLEDVDQIRSYIDMRLRLGVALAEEDQLLNGSGVAPNIQGILNRSGLTAAQARGADTNADAIFKQITTISSTVFIQPDGIVMHPTNWQTIQLTKNANGNYLGTGPWNNAQPAQLWGYPVAVTPSIVLNTALVGAFKQAAQFFRKGGLRVEASNSHADFFVKNLVAIRAEERGALAVYRPAAFGTVTGLN